MLLPTNEVSMSGYLWSIIRITWLAVRSDILPEVSSSLGVSENSKTNFEWYEELKNNWKMTIDGSDYLFTDGRESLNNSSYWLYFSTNPEYTPGEDLSGRFDTTFTNIAAQTSYTINPTDDLEEGTEYYVQIAATAFDDVDGKSFAGISDTTTLSFTTIDETAPTIAITSDASSLKAGETTTVTFTLSEASTDFVEDDISVSGESYQILPHHQHRLYSNIYDASSTTDGVISVASSNSLILQVMKMQTDLR